MAVLERYYPDELNRVSHAEEIRYIIKTSASEDITGESLMLHMRDVRKNGRTTGWRISMITLTRDTEMFSLYYDLMIKIGANINGSWDMTDDEAQSIIGRTARNMSMIRSIMGAVCNGRKTGSKDDKTCGLIWESADNEYHLFAPDIDVILSDLDMQEYDKKRVPHYTVESMPSNQDNQRISPEDCLSITSEIRKLQDNIKKILKGITTNNHGQD